MREYIEASEGMILTDGIIYGKKIFPAEGIDENIFYEITQEEYDKLIEENVFEENISTNE